jgi:hypothetical protein
METFGKVWSRLMALNPSWKVDALSRTKNRDTVVLTWVSQTEDGVLKVVAEFQETESVQRIQRSKLEVLFFPGATLEEGMLDEKKHKDKVELHKSVHAVPFSQNKGFLGMGRSWKPECPVPVEHTTIREYVMVQGAQEQVRRASGQVVCEKEDALKKDQIGQAASRAFFGS